MDELNIGVGAEDARGPMTGGGVVAPREARGPTLLNLGVRQPQCDTGECMWLDSYIGSWRT